MKKIMLVVAVQDKKVEKVEKYFEKLGDYKEVYMLLDLRVGELSEYEWDIIREDTDSLLESLG